MHVCMTNIRFFLNYGRVFILGIVPHIIIEYTVNNIIVSGHTLSSCSLCWNTIIIVISMLDKSYVRMTY